MARAIFSHELSDPDFQWLLSNYTDNNRVTSMVDVPCLPVVLIVLTPEEKASFIHAPIPVFPPKEQDNPEAAEGPLKK